MALSKHIFFDYFLQIVDITKEERSIHSFVFVMITVFLFVQVCVCVCMIPETGQSALRQSYNM